MIQKELMKSIKLMQHEALLNRLSETHPQYKRIQREHWKYSSGHKGEQSLSNIIQREMLDEEGIILYDIRLKISEDEFFQMDVSFFTSRFILIFDSKYIGGELYFEEKFSQLIRKSNNGEIDRFDNPIIQLKNQARHLNGWLQKNKFRPLPIDTLVVITHPKASISTSPNYTEAERTVTNLQGMPFKMKKATRRFQKSLVIDREVKKMARALYKQNVPLHSDILSLYNLKNDDISQGVLCLKCSFRPMVRIYGTWFCPKCENTSKTAHIDALIDYFLLLGTSINNHQFREMVKLSSISVSNKLLKQLNLNQTGTGKGRRYNLNLNDLIKRVNHPR